MFINTTKFKKMLKRAYSSSGLLMHREGDVIVLGSGVFLIRTDMKVMNKKCKAAVIELIGEFPKDGESFCVTKYGKQLELNMSDRWDIHKMFAVANPEYKGTYVLADAGNAYVRAVQNTIDNSIMWFDDFYLDVISPEEMFKEEGTLKGPRIHRNMIFWGNDMCTYAFARYDMRNEELSKLLENMELYECPKEK